MNLQSIYNTLEDPECGAAVVFVGRVRNHNEGRSVVHVQYSVHASMVKAEENRILNEAAQKFEIRRALIEHFEGDLYVGEISVVVGVASPHRADSFAAAQWIMEEVKKRLPVWKKEYYAEGDSAWPHNTPSF